MADRSIVARLRAEAGQFITTMGKARKATEGVGEGAEQASKKADKSFAGLAKSIQKNSQHIDRLGNTALIAGGSIAAGLGFGVKAFADFDEAMSSVNAALPEAGAQMDKLRQLAIDLGRDSQYSATEAAQGITELAKAGVSAEDILGGGLKGALDLAASGQLAVGDAAEIAASAMVQFGLKGDQVGHIADLLAAGAGKAQGSVADLGQALNQAGLVANATGLTIEETAGGLAAFASAGLVGSDAGTAFKSMLQRLTPQSEEAASMMRDLGISAFDAQGNFIGLSEFAGNLQTAMKDLTPEARQTAQTVIFGSDAVRAANVLYEQGADGIAKWQGAVNSAGFAAKQASDLTNNLKGDIERLGGAIDSVFVENGSSANSALRTLTQNLESAVEGFGNLPPQAQQSAFALAGITATGLLVAGAFAKAVTTGADLLESMEALRSKSPRIAKGVDGVATATRKAAKAFIALAAAGAAAEWLTDDATPVGVEKITKALLESTDVVEGFNKIVADNAAEMGTLQDNLGTTQDVLRAAFDPDILDTFTRKGDSVLKAITLGMLDLETTSDEANLRLSELDATFAGLAGSGNAEVAAEQFQEFADYARIVGGVSIEELKKKFPQYEEALAAASNQQVLATETGEGMGRTLESIRQEAEDAEQSLSDLADEIRGFGSAALDADDAEANFRDSIDRTTETVKANAEAVKEGEKTKSQATRDNKDALRDQARAALENSAATLEQTGSAEKARQKIEQGREAFIKSARQMGLNKKEAEALADKYGLIPAKVTTEVKAQGAETARKDVQHLIDTIAALNSKTVTVGVRYTVTDRGNGSRGLGGGLTVDADGGMHVPGAGGLVKAYADGGMWDGSLRTAQPKIAPAGGRGILWAEEGAGPWEAFISGHPNKRARSRVIAADTVARLGGRIEWARPFADGGVYGGGGSSHTETNHNPVIVQKLVASDVDDFRRKAAGETSWRRGARGSL